MYMVTSLRASKQLLTKSHTLHPTCRLLSGDGIFLTISSLPKVSVMYLHLFLSFTYFREFCSGKEFLLPMNDEDLVQVHGPSPPLPRTWCLLKVSWNFQQHSSHPGPALVSHLIIAVFFSCVRWGHECFLSLFLPPLLASSSSLYRHALTFLSPTQHPLSVLQTPSSCFRLHRDTKSWTQTQASVIM